MSSSAVIQVVRKPQGFFSMTNDKQLGVIMMQNGVFDYSYNILSETYDYGDIVDIKLSIRAPRNVVNQILSNF